MARRVHGPGAACRQLAAAGTLSALPIVLSPGLHGTRHQDRNLLEFLNFETDNSVSIDTQHFFINVLSGSVTFLVSMKKTILDLNGHLS